MPSSYEALRRKFMDYGDGIAKAELILLHAGYVLHRKGTGSIEEPLSDEKRHAHETEGDIYDALDFLVNEWDYHYEQQKEEP